jgi:hypothetical protein
MNFVSFSTLAFLFVAAIVGAVIAFITWRNRVAPDTVAQILYTAESAVPLPKPAVRTAK